MCSEFERVPSWWIAAIAAVTAIPVNGLDLAGGVIADRIRPNGAPFLAYPSGHTLGTIIQNALSIHIALRLVVQQRILSRSFCSSHFQSYS